MIWTLIIGLVIGFVARFLLPGRDEMGLLATMLLGVVGSFLATVIGRALHWYQPDQPAGFIMSVIGAIVLLLIFRSLRGPARPPNQPRR
jgi:uncharacterized membrane protein YeaQ/YmgE (transglycosylase-associated protein family)